MDILDLVFDEKLDSLSGSEYDKSISRMINEGLWDEIAEEDTTDDDDNESTEMKREVTQIIQSGQKKVLTDDNAVNFVTAIYDIAAAKGKTKSSFKVFRHFDFSKVTNFDAMFAYLNIPNADLSIIETNSATSMKGTFYKSGFNNDSIKSWRINRVKSFDNMFLSSDFNHPEVFKIWAPDYMADIARNPKKQPKIDTSYEDIQKAKKEIEQSLDAEFDEDYSLKSFSTLMNEGFFDNVKKVAGNIVDKIKEIFTRTTEKLNEWFVAAFDKDGYSLGAVSPSSIVNFFGSVSPSKAVQVISKVSDEFSKPVDTVSLNDTGVYPVYATDNEKKNLETLLSMGEGRGVGGYKARSGGFDERWQECGTERLEQEIKMRLVKPQGNGVMPLLIWGAPGIGKTHIPMSIVNAYNKNITDPKKRKALIVIDCGQLKSDSLSVPMPKTESIRQQLESEGKSVEGLSDEVLNKIVKKCEDAMTDALPVYKPTGDRNTDLLLNEIANGSVNPVYDEDGVLEYCEKTGDGGILMLDELFRADIDIFSAFLTLIADRKYGSCILGSKWSIIACTNRPLDDSMVESKWEHAPGALTNRFAQIQFVPTFSSWKVWAENHGFDQTTLDFFQAEVNAEGEFTNWFNYDVESRLNYDQKRASAAWPSPRSWTNCIYRLNLECETRGFKDYSGFDKDEFREIVSMYVGSDAAEDYTEYWFNNRDSSKPKFTAMNVVNGKLNDTVKELTLPDRTMDTMQVIQAYVSSKWDEKNPIPEKNFENICKFLVNNMPEGTSNQIVISTMEGIITDMGYDINSKESLKNCPYTNAMVNILLKTFKVGE